jgi:hypothetical protein
MFGPGVELGEALQRAIPVKDASSARSAWIGFPPPSLRLPRALPGSFPSSVDLAPWFEMLTMGFCLFAILSLSKDESAKPVGGAL